MRVYKHLKKDLDDLLMLRAKVQSDFNRGLVDYPNYKQVQETTLSLRNKIFKSLRNVNYYDTVKNDLRKQLKGLFE